MQQWHTPACGAWACARPYNWPDDTTALLMELNQPPAFFLNRPHKLAHSCVTLSAAKGLTIRCFAPPSMTALEGHSGKRTNAPGFDLVCSPRAGALLWSLAVARRVEDGETLHLRRACCSRATCKSSPATPILDQRGEETERPIFFATGTEVAHARHCARSTARTTAHKKGITHER